MSIKDINPESLKTIQESINSSLSHQDELYKVATEDRWSLTKQSHPFIFKVNGTQEHFELCDNLDNVRCRSESVAMLKNVEGAVIGSAIPTDLYSKMQTKVGLNFSGGELNIVKEELVQQIATVKEETKKASTEHASLEIQNKLNNDEVIVRIEPTHIKTPGPSSAINFLELNGPGTVQLIEDKEGGLRVATSGWAKSQIAKRGNPKVGEFEIV